MRACASRLLPERALAKKTGKKQVQKKTATANLEFRLVPHIPPELSKETRQFFQNQNKLKTLLELVFSPISPRESAQERSEYENARSQYDVARVTACNVYEAHEKRASEHMWRALQQLPEDLYAEAIASKPERLPEPLLFHVRHQAEVFRGLNELERRKLQCFHNLMHVRYPHSEEKQRNPQRFLIPENQVVSRQKEAAMAKKRLKKK